MAAHRATQGTSTNGAVECFISWASENHIFVHPSLKFNATSSGHDVYADNEIPRGTTVLSCPFSMAITAPQSKAALVDIFQANNADPINILNQWNERQLVCIYIVLHRIWGIVKDSPLPSVLRHEPYISMLPPPTVLLTTMYFTRGELDLLKGSNLYHATIQRREEWQAEWNACLEGVSALDKDLGSVITWENYLAAATHLSSRAFPSTLLSDKPSNTSSGISHAVLLPGIDSLNHRRATPVSWFANIPKGSGPTNSPTLDGTLDLILHEGVPAGSECFNNYGPKPNSELMLGYGFALRSNPDDTMLLSLAASNTSGSNLVEIGRDARNAERLWELVLEKVREIGSAGVEKDEVSQEVSSAWEIELQVAETIMDMTEQRMERLPGVGEASATNVRGPVLDMTSYYLEGQRAILLDVINWAQAKRIGAKDKARAEGIELVSDDEFEEEE